MTLEKLQDYNVGWTTPSADSSGSMPLGNGDIGLNVWVEENGDLLFYLSKTDAWNENCRLLKLGRIRVSLEPNPFEAGQDFSQTLKLPEGEIEIRAGDAQLRLRVDANHPLVVLDIRSESPLNCTASLEIWRTQERELVGTEAASAYGLHDGPLPIIESGDTVLSSPKNAARVVWFHRNPTSIWQNTLQLQGLEKVAEQESDPLLHRTFGGLMRGEGLSSHGDGVLKSLAPQREHSLQIHLHTAQTETPQQWLQALENQAVTIARLNQTEVLAAHREWWSAFWNRSWIFVSGDEDAETVTRGYLLQRFISACAGRGQFPIKFNGSIFTVDAREENEIFDADYRRWGGPYWFQNTRLAYWPMLANGDYEMMSPLFEMYVNALPLAQERTRIYFGHDGAFFPETMYFWGAYANANYGWERAGKSVSQVDNTFIRYYWSGALELIALMLEYSAFKQNESFIEDSLLPLAEAVLTFYHQHYPRDENGKLHFAPAQSLEMWQDAENPLPEVAGLKFVLQSLLDLPEAGMTRSRRAFFEKLHGELPPLPMTEKEGQKLIAPAQRKNEESANLENPELYAIFPYRLFGIGQPALEMARATYRARGIQRNGGWHQDAIQAAHLGLTQDAQKMVVERFSTKHESSRFPAFWGPNHDWIPDQDHGGVAMLALQAMLLQNGGETMFLFPAWPREWDVDFKLHARGQTVIEGRLRDGVVDCLKVQPESRAKSLHRQ